MKLHVLLEGGPRSARMTPILETGTASRESHDYKLDDACEEAPH